MKTVTFTEFRKRASALLTDVEHGEVLIVLRHGRPVAEVSPMGENGGQTPSWQRPALRLVTKGKSLSAAIPEERREDVS